ncbi:MAG TPA: TauD/TfdA family dioxygenase [Sphingobium sp.]|nr:TauD/TfdA family dioxygenase [Sphingobium sp.]
MKIGKDLIDNKTAWRNPPKDLFIRDLTGEELAALDQALHATIDKPKLSITREEFDHPVIRELARKIMVDLREGPGATILRGLDAKVYDAEAIERIYWGLGMHLGKPSWQNDLGDLMGYVEEEPDPENPYDSRTKGRGYRSSHEAGYHTDTDEVVGLACVRRAEQGGTSVIASIPTIYNEFVKKRPDILPALFEGYYATVGQDEVMSDQKMVIFAEVDGQLLCELQDSGMRKAAEKRGEKLPEDLVEALSFLRDTAEETRAEFLLEDGEILLWNNRTVIHGRRGFQNSPERRRLLLRLWLAPEDTPPVPDTFPEVMRKRLRREKIERQLASGVPG